MATYEYQCKKCGVVEVQQKITEEPLKKCPQCQEEPVTRLISVTSPPQFKGSGFYSTDYKKGS